MPLEPTPLYTYVKNVITSVWSAGTYGYSDDSEVFDANNGHLHIRFEHKQGSIPFLFIELIRDQRRGNTTLFDGYIRSQSDFDTLLELTRVQNPNW